MIKVLVTGSRNLPAAASDFVMQSMAKDIEQRFGIKDLRQVNFIVGDCRTGLDAIVRQHAYVKEVFKADWQQFGRAAGPARNQQMVNAMPNVCYAFPYGTSHGTMDCVRKAQRANVATIVFYYEEQ